MSFDQTVTESVSGAITGRKARAHAAFLASSASALAILVATPATAQMTTTSTADGETIAFPAGSSATVDGAPAVVVANNDVTVDNSGSLATTGVTNTIQVNQGTTGASITNRGPGELRADSRVVDISGQNVFLINYGLIEGTGNQRNGAVYANAPSNNVTIENRGNGVIDAGAGNEGAAVSIEVGNMGNPVDGSIVNEGLIQGRGSAAASGGTAGDGIRFAGPGLQPEYIYAGTITNSGAIRSESTNGTTAGIRFANRIGFQGTLNNEAGAVIYGTQNGLYFGNDADHTGGVVNNAGTITSASRALNIDGIGLVINNTGNINGQGDQRNGTVYADSTAQDFTLNNDGLIDAGEGNQGAGFSAELSEAGNDFTINNAGLIQGRGQAAAGAATAGDGIRFERTRVNGTLDASTSGLFTGTIDNSGSIRSESTQGTAAGIRFVNGTSFQGVLNNLEGGVIYGTQNGLYFGNPVTAGGGDHTGGVVNNAGTITSASRALNIDGIGLTVNNSGSILGTGAQRNGTVYADGTANNFVLNNTGTIDASVVGSGVSLQLGTADGDVRSFTLVNDGTIAGRGEAQASGASAGLRLFNGAGAGTTVSVADDIVNNGTISSETGAAVLIEGIDYSGTFTNNGVLSGVNSVDASTALSALNFIQNGGALNGAFVGSAFTDTLTFATGETVLGSDVLGSVDVVVSEASNLIVDGERTINGSLTSNGTLNLNLNEDILNVEGDATFGAGSVVNIATDLVTLDDVGTTFDVVTETGTFTNNGVIVNVADNDFLLDYVTILGSISVAVVAEDLTAVSDDANISAFGGALASAISANSLDAQVFNALNAINNVAEFEAASVSLLPAINEGNAREIYETQNQADNFIAERLNGKGTGIWTRIIGREADADASSTSVTGYDSDAIGFAVGLDTSLGENLLVGASFSYASIEIDGVGGAGHQSEIDASQLSAYFGYSQDALYVNGQLGYSFSSVDTNRNFDAEQINGNFDIEGVRARLEAGYDVGNDTFAITPFVGLQYANLSSDIYSETGGLNLTVAAGDVDFFEGRVGAAFATKGSSFSFKGSAAYVYDFAGDARVFDLGFAGTPDTFRVSAGEPSQSRFEYGAGFEFGKETGFGIGLGYQGESASDFQSHAGTVTLRFRF